MMEDTSQSKFNLNHVKDKKGPDAKYEKIAITGMGLRYPCGINDPLKFWKFLEEGGNAIRDVPPERWNNEEFYHPDPKVPGKSYVKRGAFLEDADIKEFDAPFFGISPHEAETLDPQQRILLEITYEAFRDAGIPLCSVKGKKVGTFIGGFMMDNQGLRMTAEGTDYLNSFSTQSGSLTMLSNRISHAFDFTGPSISVDTACSGSLVALHLACRSLQNGDSDIAVTGGVNVMLTPNATIQMSKGSFLAKDGHSKAFFDHADGYGRGEAAGVVVLKKLSCAMKDGDDIYAVINATAVNQDGRTPGISQPSQAAQIENMVSAMKSARILQVDYVEAHGTGTRIGDPIEIESISAAYAGNNCDNILPVGSVKANFNHTEAAAGITGIIKSALMVKYGRIPPHLNLGKLNQRIPFARLNIGIPLKGETWYENIRPRKVAVNGFGYGGTNAHAIISHYDEKDRIKRCKWMKRKGKKSSQVLTIQVSAKSHYSLRENVRMLSSLVKNHHESVPFESLAYHLNEKVDRFQYLVMFRAADMEELNKELDVHLANPLKTSISPAPPLTKSRNKVVWMFTGMGPQWWGMGQDLYEKENAFRSKLNECDSLYKKASGGHSLLREMMKCSKDSKVAKDQALSQSANFFVQVGLASLLVSWGHRPDAIIGHSVGEVAAAVVSGALSLSQGIKIILARGNILQRLEGNGTMLAAGVGKSEAESLCRQFHGIEIGSMNAANSVVFTGLKEELVMLESKLTQKGIFTKFLRVEVAYHSSQVEALKPEFMEKLSFLRPAAPKITMYSTVTGNIVASGEHDALYWFKNARQCVQLLNALQNALDRSHCHFLEIGPHPVLAPSIASVASAHEQCGIFHTLHRDRDERQNLMENIAALVQSGVTMDALFTGGKPSKTLKFPLPYVWDKSWLWEEGEKLQIKRGVQDVGNRLPFLLSPIIDAMHPTWKTSIHRPSIDFLKDHKVSGKVVFPGAAYVECALEAVQTFMPQSKTLVANNINIQKPLVLTKDLTQNVYIEVSNATNVCVASTYGPTSVVHMTSQINSYISDALPIFDKVDNFTKLSEEEIDQMYVQFRKKGLDYGAAFRGVKAIHLNEDGVSSLLEVTRQHEVESDFLVHPSLLDSAFQSLYFAYLKNGGQETLLPVEIDRVTLFDKVTEQVFCYGTVVSQDDLHIVADIFLLNSSKNIVLEVKSLRCQTMPVQTLAEDHDWLYKYTRRPMKRIESLSPYEFPTITYPDVQGRGEDDLCQVMIDCRLKENYTGDMYSQSLDKNLFLLEVVKEISIMKCIRRFVVVLENASFDEEKFPTQLVNPTMMSMIGMLRTLVHEMPFGVHTIDCDSSDDSEVLLQKLIHSQFKEDEIVIRRGDVYWNSFERSKTIFPARDSFISNEGFSQPKYLLTPESSSSDSGPIFRNFTPSPLKENQLMVKVHLSLYEKKDAAEISSCLYQSVGEVEAVGKAVENFSAGDIVYSMVDGNRIRSHMSVDEERCIKVPSCVPLEHAVQVKNYTESWLALIGASHLGHGHFVLIDISSRSLRLSACRVALTTGAVVHVVSHTQEQYDELHGLGVHHIHQKDLTGQSIAFDLMVADTPVNSKDSGATATYMKPFGRIVVLTKGVLEPLNNLQLMSFDMEMAVRTIPSTVYDAMKEVLRLLSRKELDVPSLPLVAAHEIAGIQSASVIVDFQNADVVRTTPEVKDEFTFSGDDVALVTGGCSGFGLRSAIHLADWGLKHLILASRRGVVEGKSEKADIAALRRRGVNIMEVSLDITDKQGISVLLTDIHEKGLKFCGILHSATVFADAIVVNTSDERFRKAYETKALGAFLLHEATLHLALKFFICYSSITSCIGNTGQTAYGASNCFLTGLMAYRNNRGLCGTSISWGRIGEVGVMMRNKNASDYQDNIGVHPVDPDEGLTLMKDTVLNDHVHTAIHHSDWDLWLGATRYTSSRFDTLGKAQNGDGSSVSQKIISELMQLPENERLETVEKRLADALESVTGTSAAAEVNQDMSSYGMDSIGSINLQLQIKMNLGIDVGTMEIISAATFAHLHRLCFKRIQEHADA